MTGRAQPTQSSAQFGRNVDRAVVAATATRLERHGSIVLFCGSRDWTDRHQIRLDIDWLPDNAVVVEGGARGADRIAREEALRRGLHVATVNALWDRYGKSAGYRRNAAMLCMVSGVYAYTLGTPGTAHTIALAQQMKIPVFIRKPSEASDAA